MYKLRFPTIDNILNKVKSLNDPLLAKIDISRAFRQLPIDPVDSLKLGFHWQGHYYQAWANCIRIHEYSNTLYRVFVFVFEYFCKNAKVFVFVFEYISKVFIFMNTFMNTF